MALQKLKEAKYKYQNVRYSHVLIKPAEAAVLTADPWSYLHGHLLQKITKSVGNNKVCFKRARYFSSLAEDFYRAAESVDMPTKGTLCYYGMMNLVKALLSVNKIKLEDIVEHHGITNTHGKKHSLTLSGNMKCCTNIFLEFAKLMDTPVVGKSEINLRHVFSYIPELNGIARNLGFFDKPKYLPVNIRFCVNEQSTYLLTEVEYAKGNEHSIDTEKFLKGDRKKYFQEPYQSNGNVIYRSKKRKKVTNGQPFIAMFSKNIRD